MHHRGRLELFSVTKIKGDQKSGGILQPNLLPKEEQNSTIEKECLDTKQGYTFSKPSYWGAPSPFRQTLGHRSSSTNQDSQS